MLVRIFNLPPHNSLYDYSEYRQESGFLSEFLNFFTDNPNNPGDFFNSIFHGASISQTYIPNIFQHLTYKVNRFSALVLKLRLICPVNLF